MQSYERKTLTDKNKETSLTRLKDWELALRQPKEGYRFSIDAIILAKFTRIKKGAEVIELGAGCGVISLILARTYPDSNIIAIEIQNDLYRLLKENIEINKTTNVTPLNLDIRCLNKHFAAGIFDHVVANPPFRRVETGRLCFHSQEALSRHEILINMEELLQISRFLLRPGGKLSIIYPAERTSELIAAMSSIKIEPKRLQFVYPNKIRPARLILAEGIKDAGIETKIEPPLFINQ